MYAVITKDGFGGNQTLKLSVDRESCEEFIAHMKPEPSLESGDGYSFTVIEEYVQNK